MDNMAKQKTKKAGNGRAKPLVAKSNVSRAKGHKYDCGGKLKQKSK
jgi:hypothetical protein